MTLMFPKPTPNPKGRKLMKKRSDKTVARKASAEGKLADQHMAKVAELPCVICALYGMKPAGRTVVHHVFHVRFSQAKANDMAVIPLCCGHHNHDEPGEYPDTHIPIHHAKKTWADTYGPDYRFLPWVEDMLKSRESK